jgi:uncharacterized repeat protein (TIGR03803 family)
MTHTRSEARIQSLGCKWISKTRQRMTYSGSVPAIPFILTVVAILFAIPAAKAQTFSVVYKFSGGGDGLEPVGRVIVDPAGNLYGATQFGGSFNYGTVFEVDATGQETVLHSFVGSDGLYPAGGVIRDAGGNLYGTTSYGGTAEGGHCIHGCGTVFKLDAAGKQTVLYAFTGGTDGGNPLSELVAGAGDLYGTAVTGGDTSCFVGGCGVVFELNQADQETVLHRFTDKTDGESPVGLVENGAGKFFGTTYDGGALGHGAVFEVNTAGKLTLAYSFTGGSDSGDPAGGLIRDRAGNIYGTTYGVGIGLQGYGILYKLDAGGNFTELYSFSGGSDGQYPGGLVLDAAGNLYGTALGGGTGTGCYYGGCGTIFKLDTQNNFTVLHSFTGADGELPNGLAIDGAGNLYGTALGGGMASSKCTYYAGCGTVFKLTP